MEEELRYKNYIVKFDRVPERQFDPDGFGWAFDAREPDGSLAFRVIMKSPKWSRDESFVAAAKDQGLLQVRKLIDEGFERMEYCFFWKEGIGWDKADCDEISPDGFRSPFL